MICKILGLVANTLTVRHKYSLVNRDKLTLPIQIQLSQKQTKFSQYFSTFLKSRLNFEHFQEKDDPHSSCIFEITDSERRG